MSLLTFRKRSWVPTDNVWEGDTLSSALRLHQLKNTARLKLGV